MLTIINAFHRLALLENLVKMPYMLNFKDTYSFAPYIRSKRIIPMARSHTSTFIHYLFFLIMMLYLEYLSISNREMVNIERYVCTIPFLYTLYWLRLKPARFSVVPVVFAYILILVLYAVVLCCLYLVSQEQLVMVYGLKLIFALLTNPLVLYGAYVRMKANRVEEGMKQPDVSIAVVGGGISGLYAAYLLQKKGYSNVTVFEKSDRIGGQVYTKSVELSDGQTLPLDLGALYVTSDHHVMANLFKEFGLKRALVEMPPTYIDGTSMLETLYSIPFYKRLYDFCVYVYVLRTSRSIHSLEKLCFRDGPFNTVFFPWVKQFMGPTLFNDVHFNTFESALTLSRAFGLLIHDYIPEKTVLARRFISGYECIPTLLSRSLDIKLNMPVTRLRTVGNQIQFDAASDTFTFDRVIVTVPGTAYLNLFEDDTLQHLSRAYGQTPMHAYIVHVSGRDMPPSVLTSSKPDSIFWAGNYDQAHPNIWVVLSERNSHADVEQYFNRLGCRIEKFYGQHVFEVDYLKNGQTAPMISNMYLTGQAQACGIMTMNAMSHAEHVVKQYF